MGNKTKLLVLYITILIILIATACNPIMRAERLVLNDVASSERVFRELEKSRPCANDTSFVTLLDTIYNFDTTINYKYDTINNVVTLKEAGKTIYKTKRVVEIKTGYIVDTRRLGIMADSLRFYKLSLETSTKYHKEWRFRFWLLLASLIGIFILKRFIWSYLSILR
jgi:hypothetical protein